MKRDHWKLGSAESRYFTAEEPWDVPTALERVVEYMRRKKNRNKTLLSVNINIDSEGEVGVTAVIG